MTRFRETPPPDADWTPVGEWEAHAPAGLTPMRDAARASLRAELATRPVADAGALPAPGAPLFASVAERLVLVVGELASNGLRHGRPPVAVWLSRHGARWLVRARDDGAGEPHPRTPDVGGGRGLLLVERLSVATGSFAEAGGIVVWAELSDGPPAAVRALRPEGPEHAAWSVP